MGMTNKKRNTIVFKTKVTPHKDQSLGEEIANSITHGIGAALSLAAASVVSPTIGFSSNSSTDRIARGVTSSSLVGSFSLL